MTRDFGISMKIIWKFGYLYGFLLIIFFLLMTSEVKGQEPGKLQFEYLTPEDGLSQSSVYSILQDSVGICGLLPRMD